MKMLSLPTLVVTLVTSSAMATVTEIHSMSEVPRYVTPDTLLVFDIDNTLLEASQSLGTDQWFGSLVKDNQAAGLDPVAAEKAAIAVAEKVHAVAKAQPIEALTAKMIYDLQAQGIQTLGLTARSIPMIDGSLRELQSNAINLGKNAPNTGRLDIEATDTARLQSGILFVGPLNNKGELLKMLLIRLNIRPGKIVFVDDKVKHVNNVDRFMGEMGIPVEALRYGAADPHVQAFNADLGRLELKIFERDGIILSDEQALSGFAN